MADYIEEWELNTMRERKAYLKAEQAMFETRTVKQFLAALLKLMTTERYALPHQVSDSAVEFRIVEDSQTENYRFNDDILRKMKDNDQQFMIDFMLENVMKRGVTVLRFDEGKLAFEFKQIVIQKGDVYKYGICLTASRSKVINLKTKKKK